MHTYGLQELVRWPVGRQEASTDTRPRGGLPGRAVRFLRGQAWHFLGKQCALTMVRVLGRRALPLLPGDIGRLARAISQVDLVILQGGGYIASPHLVSDICGLRLGALYGLNLARALRVPYAIWGHTFFDLNGPRSMRELNSVIRDSRITVCREHRSPAYLTERGAPKERLAVLPDTAFALEAGPSERKQELLEAEGLAGISRPLLGVNVRPIHHALGRYAASHSNAPDRQLEAVEFAVRFMREAYDVVPVLVPHGFSNALFELPPFQDDRVPLEIMMQRLARDGEAFMLQGDYSPTDLVTIYSAFDAMVSARQHVAILGACVGVPSVTIAYQKTKTHGIAQMMGLEDYVLDLGDLEAQSLTAVLERLWSRRAELRRRLQLETLPRLREQLGEYVRLTGLLSGGGDRNGGGCG